MRSLLSKIEGRSRIAKNAGIGLTLLLAGVSAASYSFNGTAARNKVGQSNSSHAQALSGLTQERVNESVGKLPLAFEPNQGQTDPQVKYIARAKGYTTFLTADSAVLRMKGAGEGVLKMKMRGANVAAGQLVALAPQPGKSNYLIGNNRAKWLTNVPHYGQVAYQGVYRGIDVVYSGNQTNLEYDFVVKPGADPNQIRVAYEGSSRFALNAQGDLELQTPAGKTVAHKPIVYQTLNGRRKLVHGEYVLTAQNEVGFKLGPYDASQSLVIDPTVMVLTYVGGTGADVANAVAVYAFGIYFTGSTTSATTFPLTPPTCAGIGSPVAPCSVAGTPVPASFPTHGAYSGGTDGAATTDAYVTKLSADGTTLLWSTFLGGTLSQAGNGIAVDASGSAYVTGATTSTDFPVTNSSVIAGSRAAFVTKLASSGQSLVYSSYFGANQSTTATAIAVDVSGNAYMGGYTNSTALVLVNPISATATSCTTGNVSNCSSAFTGTALTGVQDGLVVKFDPNGTVLFSSLIGATGVTTSVNAIAADSSSAIYIAGTATGNAGTVNAATRFPTTQSGSTGSGAASNFMASATGSSLAFATKITISSTNSPTVMWSDTIGAGTETGTGIAVDTVGGTYIAGSTTLGFALTSFQLGGAIPTGTQTNSNTPNAGYVISLAANGKTANYASFLTAPGATATQLNAIALDDAAQAYVTGVAAFTLPTSYIYVARLNPVGTVNTVPSPGAANFAGAIQNLTGVTDAGNGIAVLTSGVLRTAFLVGTTNAATSAAPPTTASYTGSTASTSPQNFLLWGSLSNTLTTPQLPSANGAAPGGGDAIFAALTFRDLVASSTNLSFTSTGIPGAAGTNQTQSITLTSVGGGTPSCPIGIVAGSVTGNFFTNGNSGGIPSVTGNTVTVTTGTQNVPILATPVTGSFQVGVASGCPFTEPTTVNVTYSSNTSYTATVGYTVGTNPPVAGLSSLALTTGIGQTTNLPATATLTINVPSGASVNTTLTISTAPTGLTCGGSGPITAGALSANPVVGGAASTATLTINTACIGAASPGTYSGSITVASPANVAAPVTIPYTITVNPGLTISGGPLSFQFASNTLPALVQTATLTASTGGPFTYVATYAPAVTGGLPSANLSIVAGASGTIGSSTSTSLSVQVTPTGLANGTYAGTINVSPTGTSTFAPVTLSVAVLIGNALVIASPTSPLNITLPTGLTGASIPPSALPNGIIINNVSSGNITITNATGVTSSFTGLITSPLILADGTTPCTNIANGFSCNYAVTVTTNNVPPGIYSGSITFKTSTPGGSSALTVSLPVTLTVTAAKPSFIVTAGTTGAAATTVLTSPVTLVGTTNGLQVCTSGAPGIALNNGSITVVSYTASATFGLNPFTVNGPAASGISTSPAAITICANPQVLGNVASGAYQGTVTVASTDALSSIAIPVTLLLNSAPGNIDLSNIGIFRAAPNGLGIFALDTDEATYNYSAATTETEYFGLSGDQPVAGDWTGTGVVRMGVFRAGAWYLDLNNNGAFDANEGPFLFGLPGDIAVVGDWNGTGVTKFGVFRCPAVGVCQWYLSTAVTPTNAATMFVPNNTIYTAATTQVFSYGLPGDKPVVNNWTGTSKADQIGVFRCPAIGVCSWIVDSNGDGIFQLTDAVYSYGLIGDLPVVGDWNDNGQRKRIGVFRNGTWILDTNGNNAFDVFDLQAAFGLPGDLVVVGKWTVH